MAIENTRPADDGGPGGGAGASTHSIQTPATHSSLKAKLQRLYGALCFRLIRLSGPNAKHDPSPGKRPLDKGWVNQSDQWDEFSTQDDAAGRAAKHLRAGGNIGLAVPPGMVVLDADDHDSLARLLELVPGAPRQQTAKGGHVVLRLPDGKPVKNRTGVIVADGVTVDVRSHGAQIAVEPSVHPSGTAYKWITPIPADLSEIPVCPSDIWDRLRGAGTQSAGTQSAGTQGAGTQSAGTQQHNNTATHSILAPQGKKRNRTRRRRTR
jgi:hypothetical protein